MDGWIDDKSMIYELLDGWIDGSYLLCEGKVIVHFHFCLIFTY